MVQLPPRSPEPADAIPPEKPDGENRRKYRPPAGIPVPKDRGIGGKAAAVIIHLLLILLAIVPFTSPELIEQMLGAGGPGPAGGGGGGHKGNGGAEHIQERTQFVQVVPPPPPKTPQLVPPPVKVIIPPKPEPPKQVVDTKAEKSDKPTTEAPATTIGTGGGTGNDGSQGNGPGTGGGKGSGAGTGTGSSVGPGTGGGNGTVYEPSPIEVIIPPLPTPKKLQGKSVLAEFDVDSTGKVVDFKFQETSDGGYNRKLREVFSAIRFRPGVNGLGTPVRAKAQITITL